jgi:hypothetical protein
MDKRKINNILISLLITTIAAFAVYWTVKNFTAVKSFFNGTQIYTSDDITGAYKNGYLDAIGDATEYETLIANYREDIAKNLDEINEKKDAIILLNNEIDDLSLENVDNQARITTLEAQVKTLQAELEEAVTTILNLENEVTYYQLLLEAYENQDKVIVTFYVDNRVYDVSIVNPGESVTDWPADPIKEDYEFIMWNKSPETKFNTNTIVYAEFSQIRTSGLDYEFFTNTEGRKGYRVTGSNNAIVDSDGKVIISEKYDDGVNGEYPVLEIGKSAFENRNDNSSIFSLHSINLPEGLEIIAERAFYNTSYTNPSKTQNVLIIPSTLKIIGKEAFARNGNLRYVNFSNGGNKLKEIGEGAFAITNLQEIELPYNLEKIGSFAFRATQIKTLVIPAFVQKLYDIFGQSSNLEVLTFATNSQLQIIYGGAMANSKLQNIILPQGLKQIYWNAFTGTEITEVVIPSSVISLDVLAFDSGVNIIRN